MPYEPAPILLIDLLLTADTNVHKKARESMDIPGYVNPRSLGNCEPNEFLKMDVLFERELWDGFIANKNTRLRDLNTWDVTFVAGMVAQGAVRAGIGKSELLRGLYCECKIGSHKPCALRVYQHPRFLALCVGLARD